MEALGLSNTGIAGVVAALVVGVVLWKVFKLALKIVVFVVGAAAIALVVALAAQHGGAALPLPGPSGQASTP